MTFIKTNLRNRLGEGHLDMIMRVKFYLQDGCVIDKKRFIKNWVNRKDRQEKIKMSFKNSSEIL